jgi:hypothetical protein
MASPGPLQHHGKVDSDGPAEAAGGRQGGAAAGAGYVEHALTGAKID